MSYAMSLKLQPKQAQSLKQNQLLIMLPQMQQAIHLLQIPVMEMVQMIEAEMERNPLLEIGEDEVADEDDVEQALTRESAEENMDLDTLFEKSMIFEDRDFEVLRRLDEDLREHFNQNETTPRTQEDDKRQAFLENSICAQVTLFGHLMEQANQTFENKEDLKLAEAIIGNFDERGYLQTSLEELSVMTHSSVDKLREILEQIKTFDPVGVGAADVRECLLLQLKAQKKEKSLAYQIIDQCYDELLHNRIPVIQKRLDVSYQKIRKTIEEEISKLDLRPGTWYSLPTANPIIPDVSVRQDGELLIVEINDEPIPNLRLNNRYLRMLDDPAIPNETKDFIKNHIVSAKWLARNISQRNETLGRIVQFLTQKQRQFFVEPDGQLTPLTMREVAEELELHESTIARAVANKYVNSPRGLVALRSFFTNAYTTNEGHDISSQTVRQALQRVIQEEDKLHPLSDEAISAKLKEQGISCARRTIAKYRREFQIGNATQRRKYS